MHGFLRETASGNACFCTEFGGGVYYTNENAGVGDDIKTQYPVQRRGVGTREGLVGRGEGDDTARMHVQGNSIAIPTLLRTHTRIPNPT